MSDDDSITIGTEGQTTELSPEEQLKAVNEELALAKERIAGLENKTKSTGDLAKKARALEKEKMTAEEELAKLKADIDNLSRNQAVVNETATRIQKDKYEKFFSTVALTEEERKLVDYHYQKSLNVDDSNEEGMAQRISGALALAQLGAKRPDELLSVASMGGASHINKEIRLSPEEHEAARKWNMTPEEWIKYKN